MSSQAPFSDTGKPVEWKQAGFHPTGKPHLFVASPRAVRIYDLVEQKELRCLRLESSSNFISCMALHPSGYLSFNNVIIFYFYHSYALIIKAPFSSG